MCLPECASSVRVPYFAPPPSPSHWEELRGDVINLDVSQRYDECFGRSGCSSDPVKLSTSPLFFLSAPFSNKYVVKEIFCEGYAASLGDEKIMLALCEILR